MSLWLVDGHIVMEDGHVVLCDECPCTGTGSGTVLIPQPCEYCPDGNGVANGISLDVSGFANNSSMPSGCGVCPGLDGTYLAPLFAGNGCSGFSAPTLICTFGNKYWLEFHWNIAASTPPYWVLTVGVRIYYGLYGPTDPTTDCASSTYVAYGTGNCFEIDTALTYSSTFLAYNFCCLTDGLTIHATAY